MKKTKNWGYPGLRLCLIIPLLLTACKVKQPHSALDTPAKNYELTIALNPGTNESEVKEVMRGLSFGAPEHKEAVFFNSVQQPEVLVYQLRAHDQTLIDNLIAGLERNGVRIISIKPENSR